MTVALLAALVAALCYGVASVLQAIGARTSRSSVFVVTQSLPYLLGLGLDAAGFAISTVALRRLPLFSVQAIVASSVVVTALLASRAIGVPLRRLERAAVAAVCVGLVLLGLSASAAPPPSSDVTWLPAIALAAVVVVSSLGTLAVRRNSSGPVLGLLAGAAFGLVSLSVRLLTERPSVVSWLTDPAVYSLALAGATALLLYAAALQRAHVTTTTAMVVTIDVLLPATVGVVFLGDRAAAGLGPLAVIGFLAAVAGAITLSRAELSHPAAGGRHRRPARPLSRPVLARS